MIIKEKCVNGVRVIHEKMSHVRSVSIGIWIRVGSVDETEEEAGIAHLIEHMLFKGTTTRTAKMLAEQFDRIGSDLNAFTSKEMTCYYATVLDDHVFTAIDLFADMIFHSLFDSEEIEKEKQVILEEIASIEDTPEEDVDEQLWSIMYPTHPIGRPIGGKKQIIESVQRQDLLRFFARYYTPDRLVVSIAGNYHSSVIERVKSLFGQFAPSRQLQTDDPSSAVFYPRKRMKQKDIEQTHLLIGMPSLPSTDDLYPLVLVDSMFGGTMSSRLFQEVRENYGLAYTVYSYYAAYQTCGAFVLYSCTSPERVVETYNLLQTMMEQVIEKGFLPVELENAKEQWKSSFLIGLENSEARMYRNGKNELIRLTHFTTEEVIQRIDAITLEEVNQLAKELFQQQQAVAMIGPNKSVPHLFKQCEMTINK